MSGNKTKTNGSLQNQVFNPSNRGSGQEGVCLLWVCFVLEVFFIVCSQHISLQLPGGCSHKLLGLNMGTAGERTFLCIYQKEVCQLMLTTLISVRNSRRFCFE